MTAVAPPLSLQPSARLGWPGTSNGNNSSFTAMNSDDPSRMFPPGPRKHLQRQNSASSLSSNSSTSSVSTVSGVSSQPNGAMPSTADIGGWGTRKKPMRGLWPGKAEPATGITTARPHTVNSATSGPPASAAISALHTPLAAPPLMQNGSMQSNGVRSQNPQDPPAILQLVPINNTFERKTITVPYYPDILRIGRQTNQKTIPTPSNGFFDSKVLSRQHAEIYADRNGHIFIRDVKSSNGTFVNGMRLSLENKESEPRELREQDVLELGIDIVSEDQKTVVHHKVAAKVEHAGIYSSNVDPLNFGELDLVPGGMMGGPHQLKRNGSSGSISGRSFVSNGMAPGPPGFGVVNQPQHLRNWLTPINTEHIVKKINLEMKLAIQQAEDLARARKALEFVLNGKTNSMAKDSRADSERVKLSGSKSKSDLKSHFPDPPAPPPSAPLPDKPEVAKALADPIIQPILRRNDTIQLPSTASSPTRIDHSSDILRLCEELKIAKGELSHQEKRMRVLEDELAQERTARESAEERALSLETGRRQDSPRDSLDKGVTASISERKEGASAPVPDLQSQLDRLHASMDEMRMQMEAFRQRAERAELDRDEARQTLAEMVEQKRKENEAAATDIEVHTPARSPRRVQKSPSEISTSDGSSEEANQTTPTSSITSSPTSNMLLETAGVEEGQPITREQAVILTQILAREILRPPKSSGDTRLYYGIPLTSAAAVIILGVVIMNWGNGWPKVDR